MDQAVVVRGLTKDELQQLLCNPSISRNVQVESLASFNQQSSSDFKDDRIKALESELALRSQEVEDLTMAAGKASISIHSFHSQQQQLFDDFVLLRSRYDEAKNALQTVLWTHCAQYHPDLRYIPAEVQCTETDEQLGDYFLEQLLGEGQFATVYACRHKDEPEHDDSLWAIKIINKDRVGSFNSIKRVSNEVRILRKTSSQYVIKLRDVIHTQKKLYIITERGGADLFEFFDEHQSGVPEPWARDIMSRILQAIAYCHAQGICHRDLKPENILMSFDTQTGKVIDLKLCDFGLSSQFKANKPLNEFCGSPGFFAPEMITQGTYEGDKADMWSVGCIMLELIMGHELFCEIWMYSYDYDTLQSPEKFADEIAVALKALPEALLFEEPCKDFVLQFLKLRGSDRPSCRTMCSHPWLRDHGYSFLESNSWMAHSNDIADSAKASRGQPMQDTKQAGRPWSGTRSSSIPIMSLSPPDSASCSVAFTPEPDCHPMLSHTSSTSSDLHAGGSPGQAEQDNKMTLTRTLMNPATLVIETRARHVIEQDQHAGRTTFHLPPIDPPTPKVASARKKLIETTAVNQLNSVIEEITQRPSSRDAHSLLTEPVGATFHKGSRRSHDGLAPDNLIEDPHWRSAANVQTGIERADSGFTDSEHDSRGSAKESPRDAAHTSSTNSSGRNSVSPRLSPRGNSSRSLLDDHNTPQNNVLKTSQSAAGLLTHK